MNRQQRRKLKKNRGLEDTSIQVKKKDLDRIELETITKAIPVTFGMLLKVMRDDWGFGKTRLTRLADQLFDELGYVESGHVDFEDYEDLLEAETGIKIRRG